MNHNEANDILMHYGVLGMKWGQRRARKFATKSAKASAKGKTEKAQKYKAKSEKIKSYHQKMGGKKTYERVAKTSTGKAIAQSMLMGTYGSLKYNEARAKGQKRGKAAVNGLLYGAANSSTGGIVSVVEPRLRKKRGGKEGVRADIIR